MLNKVLRHCIYNKSLIENRTYLPVVFAQLRSLLRALSYFRLLSCANKSIKKQQKFKTIT